MTTPDEQWWEAQAGEYVLGTLRGAERDVFEKILAVDEEVRGRVERWQQRLSDLDVLTLPIQPPDYLLPAIMSRISEINNTSSGKQQSLTSTEQQHREESARPEPSKSTTGQRLRSLSNRRSNTIWKSVAGLATAATIAMAAFVLQTVNRDVESLSPILQTVSVVQNEQKEAIWLLSTQSGTNQLQVVALTAPPVEADKSYQLWMIKPDNAGVSSVGLLSQTEGESQALTLPIGTDQAQLFAVSLEPKGGSPEAGPTGPVLFQGTIINL
ncbi:anti-sigma factor [Granulosicoccus antarcticus]|uniref:Anti-sigma K factor RskA C-terminal domain-containing protein n=1 Tax=Granulosicoccus antarcticus IMCC3135 TaxID=1192854 RepID=A0A2Z2NWL6_9GAMM|nr:anti-sigma factor [Granulosicoccus antarcticus]ASJ75856.1 hypothetical protein IMCC3135_29025 [Granulosicoccus antarcticus IMCC3135]